MADHPTLKLGRRPADPKRPALRLGNYLTGAIPAHPPVEDFFGNIPEWVLGGNTKWGTCGPTSVANQRLQVSSYLTGQPQKLGDADVFDLYRRSGNPGFDPNLSPDDPRQQDQGVEMSSMLSEVTKNGIAGIRSLAFAKVDLSNVDEIRAAIAIFGSVLFGVDLETAQQAQTDAGLWDFKQSGVWGGHAILAGLYTSHSTGSDISVITWARKVGTTDLFIANQLSECWVVLWPEHLGSRTFLEGVDLAALAKDYKDLTGRDFPVPIPPAPPPTPIPPPVPPPPPPNPKPGPNPNPSPDVLKRVLGQLEEVVREIKALLSGK